MRSLTLLFLVLTIAACGGGGGGGGGSPDSPTPDPGSGPVTPTPDGPVTGDPSASDLAAYLGRANRLLIGLGGTEVRDIQTQGLSIDIYDNYLPDYGPGNSWTEFESPAGAFVNTTAAEADSLGAVPMYTLYGMAINGDGNLATLDSRSSMQYYWNHAVLMFDRLAIYNKPALVNLEPDFWGYVQLQAPAGDPNQRFAYVKITPDCAALPNTVVGLAQCMRRIARIHAPKVLIGFPPADFGFDTASAVQFMNRIGAQEGDFVVQQTLDRDAGCFEAASAVAGCADRDEARPYWTDADFAANLEVARQYHVGIGGLPIVWWQTPLGVPSASFGTPKHFRDNRVKYFLENASRLVAVGGVAAVFGVGEENQTDITTDGGQFRSKLGSYLARPAPLPTAP